jgi:hypothetical protein
MTQKIMSRPITSGHEHESEWPPREAAAEPGRYYWDAATRTFKRGHKPDTTPRYGEAPLVSTGNLTPQRHPMTGEVIDNLQKWEAADKATGCFTSGSDERAPDRRAEHARKRQEDYRQAREKAIAQIDNGTAPLTEETRELCRIQNDVVSNALNFNAHDVVGRKDSRNGKRLRKKFKR